jgi:DNA helicase HerA-like ATPase
MSNTETISVLIGGAKGKHVALNAKMANRHGMIAGATGTGKTITMQVLAEGFSRAGVPVFLADVKGDVSGLALQGKPHPKVDERIESIGIDGFQLRGNPVVFWDMYGKKGHPVRTTITELGPLLIANLLGLSDAQEGVLYAAFKIADEEGLSLLDLEDLQALLGWMSANRKELVGEYGNFTSASIGSIQRDLLVLEQQGGETLLGEPALNIDDLMKVDFSGQGVISIMDVTTVMNKGPKLYSTFLLWLMSELFENLPEVGDQDKPKFVMFFDEAHLIFDDAPKALLDKIEQVVRLIRSKGVGIYFVSQSPMDIPEDVLGQLGMKIQHALRAFTPKEKKAVKMVAQNFRANPELDSVAAITDLGVGEALVSVLDEKGAPSMVERTLICPPQSRIGPVSDKERKTVVSRSPMYGRYEEAINRESAKELLKARADEKMKKLAELEAQQQAEKSREAQAKAAKKPRKKSSGYQRQTATEALVKSLARSLGGEGGRLLRGVLGSLLGRK